MPGRRAAGPGPRAAAAARAATARRSPPRRRRRSCRRRPLACRRRPPCGAAAGAAAAARGRAAAGRCRRAGRSSSRRCRGRAVGRWCCRSAVDVDGRGPRRRATRGCGMPKLPLRRRRRVPPPGTARLMAALTTMSPNCSGLLSRPRVSIGRSNACRASDGGWPIRPAGASRFWFRTALATSMAVMLQRRHFLRIEPDADAVVALALVDARPKRPAPAAARPGP